MPAAQPTEHGRPHPDPPLHPKEASIAALSEHDALAAFEEHIVRKAKEARQRYGPCIGPDQILAILGDPEVVRYPVTLTFECAFLEPHEFAWPKPLGFHPRDGYCLFLHPCFESRREAWPLLIAYHIPTINYGRLAGPRHAELFVSILMGLEVEDCYHRLCELADSMPRFGSSSVALRCSP